MGQRLIRSPHRWPVLIIVGAVLAGNALYLLHIFNPDPLNLISGIGEVTKAGVFNGAVATDPNNGITAQTLGHLVALDWFHGHVPWWNPFEGLGAPLASEMQAAAFFPPTLLLYLADGQVYSHALVELVAGLSTYFLLVRLRLGRPAAVAGAIAFALNGTYAWFSHAPTNPVCFLPLLLLGCEMAVDAVQSRRPLGWCTIAIALAASLYAGFPETAYIDGLLAAVWVVARAITLRGDWWRLLLKVAQGGVAGALLAAPIIVAFADYVPVADVGPHNGMFGSASVPHAALAQAITPYVYGPINAFSSNDKSGVLTMVWGSTGGYLTAAFVVLALIGLYGRRHRILRIGLVLWVALAMGRTYGLAPVQHLVNALPVMNDVAFFRYANPSWELAVIVLAAFGFDDIVRGLLPRWWIAGASLGGLVLVVMAHIGAGNLLDHIRSTPASNDWAMGSLLWGLGIIAAVGLAALVGRGRARIAVLLALVAADALGAFVIPQFSAPKAAHIDASSVRFLQRHLGNYRYYSFGPLGPDYGSYFGLSSLDVDDLPVPKVWGTFVTTKLDTNTVPTVFNGYFRRDPTGVSAEQEFFAHITTFEDAGVKYLVTFAQTTLPPLPSGRHLPLVFADPSLDVFQLPHPEPIFSVRGGGCRLQPHGVAAVTVDCPTSRALIRRELTMPGWQATVNGTDVPVRSYDKVYEQVKVPAGRSTITFTFAPPHLDLAVVALAAGVLAIGVLPIGLRRRARRSAL
jgi:hypothetical protein